MLPFELDVKRFNAFVDEVRQENVHHKYNHFNTAFKYLQNALNALCVDVVPLREPEIRIQCQILLNNVHIFAQKSLSVKEREPVRTTIETLNFTALEIFTKSR